MRIPLDNDTYLERVRSEWYLYKYSNFIRILDKYECLFVNKTIECLTNMEG